MTSDLALCLSQTIEREHPHLRALPETRASVPRAAGKWCPKEELGHLIDSAANNHLRFVRAAIETEFHGPGYAQDDWVRLHDYAAMPWAEIVSFWFGYNLFLTGVVKRIPENKLPTKCFIGSSPAVTLHFVIEDYILHMQHHIDQILGRAVITQYPGAALSAM
jgi:hypothetical protein